MRKKLTPGQTLAHERWKKATAEDRAAVGKRLAEARKAKRALDLAITDEAQRAPIDDEPA